MSNLNQLEKDLQDTINNHFENHGAHPQQVAKVLAEMIPSLLNHLAWKPQNVEAAITSAEETLRHLSA